MFSSNQILDITGDIEQMEGTLEFALKYSGDDVIFRRGDSVPVWQTTDKGDYCIGYAYDADNIPKGWNGFSFGYDTEIISLIIKKHLLSQKIEYGAAEGAYDKGFYMKCIPECFGDEYEGIKNPQFGIVSFSPYTVFYSK